MQQSKGNRALQQNDLLPPRTWQAAEKDVIDAIAATVAGKDPLLNRHWVKQNSWDFVTKHGSPELKEYQKKYSSFAPWRRLRYEAFTDFGKGGEMRARTPDSVVLMLDPQPTGTTGIVEITDITTKTNINQRGVHEFKTLFYTDAFRAMFHGTGPEVSGYDFNTKLHVHKPF